MSDKSTLPGLFAQVPGSLIDVSVGSDGTVWGVNSNDQIFHRNSDKWMAVPGFLSEISAGIAAHVWGVNRDQMIFKYSPTIE